MTVGELLDALADEPRDALIEINVDEGWTEPIYVRKVGALHERIIYLTWQTDTL